MAKGEWVVRAEGIREWSPAVMRNLGVQIVWCKDYDDIGECLGEVQHMGYDPEFGRRSADYPS
jgi:hypothetical protein